MLNGSHKVAPSSVAIARKVAWVLDDCHLDPVVGFFLPAAGDVLGGLAGLSIIAMAARHGVPRATLARMLLNTALDTVLGALPLVGDAFDWWFRANSRNVALFERATTRPYRPWLDNLALAGALLLCLAAFVVPIVAGVWLLRWALR